MVMADDKTTKAKDGLMNEEEVRNQCISFLRHSENNFKLLYQHQRSVQGEDFYRGQHYTKEEYEVYKSKGVEPIVINRSFATVNNIVGEQLQNRRELKVRPVKNGTEVKANVQTVLLRHACDTGSAVDDPNENITPSDYLFSELFCDGGIRTESYLTLDVNKRSTPGGKFVIRRKSIVYVIVDPDANEYDIDKTAKYVIIVDWEDKDTVKARYPDKTDEISAGVGMFTEDEDPTGTMRFLLEDDQIESEGETNKIFRCRVMTVWWKEITKGVLFYDKSTGQSKLLRKPKMIAKARKLAKTNINFSVSDEAVPVLHRTKMLGRLILEDEKNPFTEDITIIPVFRYAPYFDNGYSIGVLDNIISLNREEDINRTQATRLLNQTVNAGWKIKKATTPGALKKLEMLGAVPGFVLEEQDYGGKAEKMEPNQLSQGHMILGEQSSQDIKEVSGRNDASQGIDTGKVESGRALIAKQRRSTMNSETPFNNLARTMDAFGNLLLKMIRVMEVYTEEEVRDLIADSDLIDMGIMQRVEMALTEQVGAGLPEPMPPQPPNPAILQMVAEQNPDDLQNVYGKIRAGIKSAQMYAEGYPAMKRNWDEIVRELAIQGLLKELYEDKGEYAVKVVVSSSAPTVRVSNMMELSEVYDKFPGQLPPDLFIDATDLPNKEELKARLRQVPVMPAQMGGAAAA
jgi:hypothetical protein